MTSSRGASGRASRNHKASIQPRLYAALVNAHDSNTSGARETLVTPSKGRRIRLLKTRLIQEQPDGRHLWELYFGTGSDITVNPDKAVDILDVPNLGETRLGLSLKTRGPGASGTRC